MKILQVTVFFLISVSAFSAPLDCSKLAGSLPNPRISAGTSNLSIPIEHILVIVQENHSFDSYLGRLNQPQYYGSEIDGVTSSMTNPDSQGNLVKAYHETNLCIADTDHSWNGEHRSWNNGALDQFVILNGARTMAYYDEAEIPYYYELANQFAVADRYFCPVLTSTFPNRFFLYAATAFGHIRNDMPSGTSGFSQKTVFDLLDKFGVSWKYYTDDIGYLKLFQPMWNRDQLKMAKMDDYKLDLQNNALPQVVFIDSAFDGQDEHPAANVQIGQAWVASIVDSLIKSSSWNSSALFLTYDENGGFADHVAPPQACVPDSIAPMLISGSMPGAYDRYGFRVPMTVVSPYSKRHYVSHVTYDHTSILKFIETKFNLPALTARDANADAMLEMFNFTTPVFSVPALPQVTRTTGICKPTP